MGIPTLIKTETASNSAALAFVDGASSVVLDSTYDEYMFVFTDIGPATDGANFTFQVNATDDAGGDYDTSLITSTNFVATHGEDGSNGRIEYVTAGDLAQSTSYQPLGLYIGSDSDESYSGILNLYAPSSTTYVKHFTSTGNLCSSSAYTRNPYVAGYIDDTTAIDEIQFKMSSGNFDGVIQLYGIA